MKENKIVYVPIEVISNDEGVVQVKDLLYEIEKRYNEEVDLKNRYIGEWIQWKKKR